MQIIPILIILFSVLTNKTPRWVTAGKIYTLDCLADEFRGGHFRKTLCCQNRRFLRTVGGMLLNMLINQNNVFTYKMGQSKCYSV